MRARTINCYTCRAWDQAARRCRFGKVNPRRKHEAQTVAEMLGAQSLCMLNPYREPLLLRMRYPDRPFVWADAARRLPRPAIEVELLPDGDETSP